MFEMKSKYLLTKHAFKEIWFHLETSLIIPRLAKKAMQTMIRLNWMNLSGKYIDLIMFFLCPVNADGEHQRWEVHWAYQGFDHWRLHAQRFLLQHQAVSRPLWHHACFSVGSRWHCCVSHQHHQPHVRHNYSTCSAEILIVFQDLKG